MEMKLVPMASVADVERSIAFYQRLGFDELNRNTPQGWTKPSWAWLQCGHSHIMVSQADEPVVPSQQAVLFYLYCKDVSIYHGELREAGIAVGEIEYPFFAPKGQFSISDPDGYCLMVMHT
jgi:catechol 2,3-dioxygenase-like lactoylglutathione lyase family enzyme